jgi:RNA polymerase sigma-70 factor (ECF subfamily)
MINTKRYNDKELYLECYQKFFGVTMRYCRNREDAMEVFNDGMVKIINNYKEGKINEESFFGWCKTVIIHTAIDFLRKKKLDIVEFDFTAERMHGREGNSGEQSLLKEDILREIQKLPNKTRTVFNLYVFEGMSHREISNELEITEGTSHWHVNNARKIIRDLLKNSIAIAL